MRNIFRKVCAWILMISMIVVFIPVQEVRGATDTTGILSKTTVSDTEVYPGDIIDVTLNVTGMPDENIIVPSDIVMILDCSGSMSGTKIDTLRTAAANFIDLIDFSAHRVGIVLYDSSVNSYNFSTDADSLKNIISGIQAGSTTATDKAVNAAVSMLEADSRAGAKPAIVIVTDGAADDYNAAETAATEAKDHGFSFYTIGLVNNIDSISSSEQGALDLLKRMATTEIHHHFVGAEGLVKAYQGIAERIGHAGAYNVVVSQTLPDVFELVSGSADDNIPLPTMNGQTISWEMLELHDTTLTLSYQMKVKTDAVPGKYNQTTVGKIDYETYAGIQRQANISPNTITINEIPDDLDVTEVTPTEGEEGTATQVYVYGKNFIYGPKFKVTLGGVKVNIYGNSSTDFRFKTPTTLAAGTYDIVVYTWPGSSGQVIGQFTYTPKPDSEKMVITSMTPIEGEEGKSTQVFVYGRNLEYNTGCYVTVGGVKTSIYGNSSTEFRFKTPASLAVGSHEVMFYNGTGVAGIRVGSYQVKAEQVPQMAITSMTPTEGEEGKSTQVFVYGTNLEYETGIYVTVGGVKTSIYGNSSTEFRFKTPASLPVGTHDVIVYNGTAAPQTIGQFEVKVKPVPQMSITSMAPTEGKEGVATQVFVYGTNLEYETGIYVTVGGVKTSIYGNSTTEFRFKTPASLPVGTHDVIVYNGTAAPQTIGQFEVKAEPVPQMAITSMTPTEGKEGVATQVFVYGTNLEYETGIYVTVGGVKTSIYGNSTTEFRFKTPASLPVGNHDVIVYNGTAAPQTIGQFEVKAEPVPQMAITSLSTNKTTKGEATQVFVYGTNLKYETGVYVTVGGVKTSIYGNSLTEFRFKMPTSLAEGTYDVVIYNGSTTGQTIGQITVEKPIDPAANLNITKITPNSGKKGAATQVYVYGKGMTYKSGCYVTVGGVKVSIYGNSATVFRFKTPKTLAVGTYDIIIYNGSSTGQVIGQYTVTQ